MRYSASGLDQRRTREVEVDVLVGHECASRSPAADLLWERVGWDPPTGWVKVEYQQLCGDGRVADLRVTAEDGRQLIVEDKAAGGQFQQGQVANYRRVVGALVRTVLIAPASFLEVHRRQADSFSAAVSLEELSGALESPLKDAKAELAASYAHRREEFLRCARDIGWVGNPDEGVRAFGDLYRQLAQAETGGELALTPRTLTNASARMVEFVPWAAHDNFKPFHKLDKGLVDVRVKGFSLHELRERLEAPGAQTTCPEGWTPAAQGKSKYPVLRYRVGVVGGALSADSFEQAQPVIVEALRALCSLKSWWVKDGAKLLSATA